MLSVDELHRIHRNAVERYDARETVHRERMEAAKHRADRRADWAYAWTLAVGFLATIVTIALALVSTC
jgi:hypothetical protein